MDFAVTETRGDYRPSPVTPEYLTSLQAEAQLLLLELATRVPEQVPFVERMAWYDDVEVPIISLRDVNRLALALYSQHWGNLLAFYPTCYLQALLEFYEVREAYEVCARIQADLQEWQEFEASHGS